MTGCAVFGDYVHRAERQIGSSYEVYNDALTGNKDGKETTDKDRVVRIQKIIDRVLTAS